MGNLIEQVIILNLHMHDCQQGRQDTNKYFRTWCFTSFCRMLAFSCIALAYFLQIDASVGPKIVSTEYAFFNYCFKGYKSFIVWGASFSTTTSATLFSLKLGIHGIPDSTFEKLLPTSLILDWLVCVVYYIFTSTNVHLSLERCALSVHTFGNQAGSIIFQKQFRTVVYTPIRENASLQCYSNNDSAQPLCFSSHSPQRGSQMTIIFLYSLARQHK